MNILPELKRRDELSKLFYAVHQGKKIPAEAIDEIEKMYHEWALEMVGEDEVESFTTESGHWISESTLDERNYLRQEIRKRIKERI